MVSLGPQYVLVCQQFNLVKITRLIDLTRGLSEVRWKRSLLSPNMETLISLQFNYI